ncbi:MAG: hypothetical protein CMJ94_06500 [Planctomycetes bacterium]|nr:hypothetical protein [Planctomycetota bacterium]
MKIPHSILIAALLGGMTAPSLLAAQGGPSGPTVRWEIDDEGARWICTSVALGDDGAVLIAGQQYNDPALTVHSTADAQAILEMPLPDTWQVRVDAAAHAQTLAAMVLQEDTSASSFTVQPELHVWREARDGAADWVYRFPEADAYGSQGMDVHLSDDGQTIVAWFSHPTRDRVMLRVFDLDGNLLLQKALTRQLGVSMATSAMITPDAKRMLIDLAFDPHLIDLETGDTIHAFAHHSMFGGMALSADGTTVAIGGEPWLEVHRQTIAGDFQLAERIDFQGNRIAGPMALDADGSHLAYSIRRYSPSESCSIRARDLHAGRDLWRHKFEAPGNGASLWPQELALTEDAQIVAGSSWGDTLDLTPTGFAFDASGTLTAQLHTSGSAIGFDMDPTGQLMALGTKDAHANEFGSGGDVICADTRPMELRLAGYPQAGAKLDFSLRGPAAEARVAVASALGATPTPWGVSQLDLASLRLDTGSLPMNLTGLQRRLTVPEHPGIVGTALHLQGVLLDPSGAAGGGHLTNRVSVRVLP